MTIALGVVMDPIHAIHYHKDTTLAMLWEANRRGWKLFYMEPEDLFAQHERVFATVKPLQVFHDEKTWFSLGTPTVMPMRELNVILMRKDPPVDLRFIYTTQLLTLAAKEGVLILNDPYALRGANEKLMILNYPECIPETIVTTRLAQLQQFLAIHKKIVIKPLSAMAGRGVFCLEAGDMNTRSLFDVITEGEQTLIMAQRYIDAISETGDKRILLVNGKPIGYALARMPGKDDFRGNLAQGAQPVVRLLSTRDHWICENVGPKLAANGFSFVGLDVIGDYLTEINVTSPTGVREVEKESNLNICEIFFDYIETKL